MSSHREDVEAQARKLGALAALAQEGGAAGVRALLQAGGGEAVVSAMDEHPDNVEVQHWGSLVADLVEAIADEERPVAVEGAVPEDDPGDADDTASTADTCEVDGSNDVAPTTPQAIGADGYESVD